MENNKDSNSPQLVPGLSYKLLKKQEEMSKSDPRPLPPHASLAMTIAADISAKGSASAGLLGGQPSSKGTDPHDTVPAPIEGPESSSKQSTLEQPKDAEKIEAIRKKLSDLRLKLKKD